MIINTIEDLLEITAQLVHDVPKIQIAHSDVNIMYSVATQVFKGTALTDRQYALMQEKLELYKDQFSPYCDFDQVVTTLRHELRTIDRSKYIKISEDNGIHAIEVRFPFSKKLIVKLESAIIPSDEHWHPKGSHKHFFTLTEKNIVIILDIFKDSNFEIDKDLVSLYNEIKLINADDYIIRIEDNNLINLHPEGKKVLEEQLGPLDENNVICYKDRSILYGISKFDDNALQNIEQHDILTKKIANRNHNEVHISTKEWSIDALFESLSILKRFPLVIFLDDQDPYTGLVSTYPSIRNFIDSSEISVLYRLSGDASNGYNEYIRDNNLNNPLDTNTKIVYTNRNKVNKPLLQSDCTPITALMYDNLRTSSSVATWVKNFDLVIDFAESENLIPRFYNSRRY